MKDGYIRVAAGSVNVCVANPEQNKAEILACMRRAHEQQVNVLVLPELCVTGYSCGDLFLSQTLIGAARQAAQDIIRATAEVYPVVVFGLPLAYEGRLYDCAAVAHGGRLLGVVPKVHLSVLGGLDESRIFCSGALLKGEGHTVSLGDMSAPFGPGLVFRHDTLGDYAFGVEVGGDVFAPVSPAGAACAAGATLVVNPSAFGELLGKAEHRRMMVVSSSARLICAYACAGASTGESTQDTVFAAHHMIAENGRLLAENEPFGSCELILRDIDVLHLARERAAVRVAPAEEMTRGVGFDQAICTRSLCREVEKNPFLPASEDEGAARAGAALDIQSHALARRLAHTKAKAAVIGISGGLDSTLALLVAVRAMKLLGRPNTDIVALTMPCFGTTQRTKSNAVILCERLGVTLRQIGIADAVTQHFADIGHNPESYDVTFENAQARERTQVLMDVANQVGGIVIGTGDLSELALGWATYNGDHMSMYGVNAGIPKTLVRHLVAYEAAGADDVLRGVLQDILDTPVSPELLPCDSDGQIAQKTEDAVGPYELHDFFLYYVIRYGDTPEKIFRLSRIAFAGVYDDRVILHWLGVFHRRFFAQQFKRSCLPDGPAVESVSLSPRGAWHMPSDADAGAWMSRIDAMKASL